MKGYLTIPVGKKTTKVVAVGIIIVTILSILLYGLGEDAKIYFRERNLISAINNQDLEAFHRYSVNKPPEQYSAGERDLTKRIGMNLLRKFVSSDQTLWNDAAAEKSTVFWFLMLGDSQIHGGLGIGDTPEGFNLMQQAMEKLVLIYPEYHTPTKQLFIHRLQDGSVATGIEITSR